MISQKASAHLHHRVHARQRSRSHAILLIVFQQRPSSFFVERRLGVRVDKETLDGHEDVRDAEGRLPVFLERVDADFASRGDIGVEYLGDEAAYAQICESAS